MTVAQTERYLTQLRLWRGIVRGLSDTSRMALREALAETGPELKPGVDAVERTLRRHADALTEVA